MRYEPGKCYKLVLENGQETSVPSFGHLLRALSRIPNSNPKFEELNERESHLARSIQKQKLKNRK